MKRLIVIFVTVLIIDQFLAFAANRELRTEHFFISVLEDASLDAENIKAIDSFFYQDCELHTVFILYTAKTCFDLNGWSNSEKYGPGVVVFGLHYWPPASKIMYPFYGYYYQEACCNEVVLRVTRDKKIVENFVND